MLEKLDRNVCYCDTDSIVYIENEETKKIVYRRRAGRMDRRGGRKSYQVLVQCTGEGLWLYTKLLFKKLNSLKHHVRTTVDESHN